MIAAEHARARALSAAELKAFVARGVPVEALSRTPCGRLSMLSRDRVVFDRRGRFEFARDVRGDNGVVDAFTLPLFNEIGDATDILAADPAGNLALWRGAVAMAGQEQVFAARVVDEALDVHEALLDWLRANRRGIVILDHRRAAPLLHLAAPLKVATRRQQAQLERALAIPAPKIVVGGAQAAGRAA